MIHRCCAKISVTPTNYETVLIYPGHTASASHDMKDHVLIYTPSCTGPGLSTPSHHQQQSEQKRVQQQRRRGVEGQQHTQQHTQQRMRRQRQSPQQSRTQRISLFHSCRASPLQTLHEPHTWSTRTWPSRHTSMPSCLPLVRTNGFVLSEKGSEAHINMT